MEALSPQQFKKWLRAYHDANPGAAFPPLSLLADASGKTTYERLADIAVATAERYGPAPAILDAGCGDGMLLALIAARAAGARLYGVDQSAGELEIARATLEPFGAELIQADVAATPLPPASMDLAISHMVLMLLSDPLRALAELARVLKPGASLAFVVGRVGRAHGILEFAAAKTAELLASEEKPLPQLDRRFATIEGLSGLPWRDLGFDGAAVATIDLSRRLSMEQLTSYVSDMYGPLMLSAGGRELLERALIDRAWTLADENALVETRSTAALVAARRL